MSYNYEEGLALLAKVDGSGGHEVIENLNAVNPDLGKYIVEYAFGEIYQREGIDLKTREIVTITSLAAMGECTPQLKVHINGALNVGIAKEEILEIFLHLSVYCGFPKAINAMFAAQEVFGERGLC